MAQPPPPTAWQEHIHGRTCKTCRRQLPWQTSYTPANYGRRFVSCRGFDAVRNIQCEFYRWDSSPLTPPRAPVMQPAAAPVAALPPIPFLPLTQPVVPVAPVATQAFPPPATQAVKQLCPWPQGCTSARVSTSCMRKMCATHCKLSGGCSLVSHGRVLPAVPVNAPAPTASTPAITETHPAEPATTALAINEPSLVPATAPAPPTMSNNSTAVVTVKDVLPNPRYSSHIIPVFTERKAQEEAQRNAIEEVNRNRIESKRRSANTLRVFTS
ncbi:hypothetical protein K435DRAFT_870039 [Dendrothele bispora CBS 962.96]|uniref:Zinc finger GRF-type domain-containing protein n=1 Tax=Dendrothele bispora (strain CBS 962.96) TaxID=1314807 RepID=A0A4S8L7K0_DENBC|nr:hypothetical protein K435DRAFT_870039 [Dendrothele bispora CBS 962.96]